MSREELINYLKEYIDSGAWKYEGCYLCKEDLELIVKALEQEPCEDCKTVTTSDSIQALMEIYDEVNRTENAVCYLTSADNEVIKSAIKALREQKAMREHDAGHWIEKKSMIYCSRCGASIEAGYLYDMNYCFNCGRRMESEG